MSTARATSHTRCLVAGEVPHPPPWGQAGDDRGFTGSVSLPPTGQACRRGGGDRGLAGIECSSPLLDESRWSRDPTNELAEPHNVLKSHDISPAAHGLEAAARASCNVLFWRRSGHRAVVVVRVGSADVSGQGHRPHPIRRLILRSIAVARRAERRRKPGRRCPSAAHRLPRRHRGWTRRGCRRSPSGRERSIQLSPRHVDPQRILRIMTRAAQSRRRGCAVQS
jgi:hypothetical protein